MFLLLKVSKGGVGSRGCRRDVGGGARPFGGVALALVLFVLLVSLPLSLPLLDGLIAFIRGSRSLASALRFSIILVGV